LPGGRVEQLFRGGQVGHLLYGHDQAVQLGRALYPANVAYQREGRSRKAYQQGILKRLLHLLPELLFLLPAEMLFLLPAEMLFLLPAELFFLFPQLCLVHLAQFFAQFCFALLNQQVK